MIRKKKSIKIKSVSDQTVCGKRLLSLLADFFTAQNSFPPKIGHKNEYLQVANAIQKYLPRIYKAYDEYSGSFLKGLEEAVFCSKGCGYCCSHNVVSVEPYEIIFIDRMLKQNSNYGTYITQFFHRWSVYEKIAQKEKKYDEDVVLYKDFLKGTLCPFLSPDEGCVIYSFRPISCRMFYSLSEPRLCKGKNIISSQNRNITVELPDEIEELLSSTGDYFEQYDISSFLFKGLLDVNQLFGKYPLEK